MLPAQEPAPDSFDREAEYLRLRPDDRSVLATERENHQRYGMVARGNQCMTLDERAAVIGHLDRACVGETLQGTRMWIALWI